MAEATGETPTPRFSRAPQPGEGQAFLDTVKESVKGTTTTETTEPRGTISTWKAGEQPPDNHSEPRPDDAHRFSVKPTGGMELLSEVRKKLSEEQGTTPKGTQESKPQG